MAGITDKIVPQTTSIPLSERFKILENKTAEQPSQPAVVGAARSFLLALDSANESVMSHHPSVVTNQHTRISAKQRLGPKVEQEPIVQQIFVNKRFQPRFKAGNFMNRFRKPFKRTNVHVQQKRVMSKKVNQQQFIPQSFSQTRIVNKFVATNRFKWHNPSLVKKPFRRPPKAKRDQLDNDLDEYMSQSTGYLNSGHLNITFS